MVGETWLPPPPQFELQKSLVWCCAVHTPCAPRIHPDPLRCRPCRMPTVRFVSDSNLVLPTTTTSTTTAATSTTGDNSSSSDTWSCAAAAGGWVCRGPGSSSSSGRAPLHVPRGSILCICPIESHHDGQLYPDEPWAFKPDRCVDRGVTL